MALGIRLRRQRATTRYYEEDSDSGQEFRPIRSRGTPNYVDVSSDDEILASENESRRTSREPSPSLSTNRLVKRKHQPNKSTLARHPKRQRVIGASVNRNRIPSNEVNVLWQASRAMPWSTLEHDILTSVLKYAAYPLYQGYLRPNTSIKWLVAVSYLCKSLHNASISALFFCPPLINGSGLLDLLKLDQDTLLTNYRMKPRKLVIEAKNSLFQKAGRISLPSLVSFTPFLESLRIVSHYDEVPFSWARPSIARKDYIYDDQLFISLETSCPRLKEFEWNGRFAAGLNDLLAKIENAHSRLTGLTSVTLMNIEIPEKSRHEDASQAQTRLLSALNILTNLEHLKIINCDVFGNFAVLESLRASSLKSLTIIGCNSLTGFGLESFLNVKGANMERLRLSGCQACDGAFLSRLGSKLCKGLQSLQVDLTFSDSSSWNDNEPHFEDFLPDGPISFPSTLVDLELTNIRKIDAAQLEASLESLVASKLTLLRYLSVKVILTSDYRVRARIRNEWGARLDRIFLRHSAPPASYTPSRTKFLGKQGAVKEPSAVSPLKESNQRRSGRVVKSLSPTVPTGERNIKQRAAPSYQGLCELVEFRIDDQRPSETQFVEADFY